MLILKHPLENPSLAPLGLRTKLSYQRLQYVPPWGHAVFEERMIVRFWEKCNRLDAPRPWPVETIIHRVLPAMAAKNRLVQGDFEFAGYPYLTRDIVTLSSTVQWFGTNCGRAFLDEPVRDPPKRYHPSREFELKLEREKRLDRSDIYAFLSHRCTNACNRKPVFGLVRDSCVIDSHTVAERDRAVIDGLMRWLGTSEGRQFLFDFRTRRNRAWNEAGERRQRKAERRRTTAKAA